MALTINEKKFLLKLARGTIEHFLKTGNLLKLDEKTLLGYPDSPLREKKGCFVTLNVHSALRGCIGHLLPVQPLYKDVIENAYNAAFQDPRFPPMVKSEFDDVSIEISVLDVPQKLDYKDAADLVAKISKTKPGIILGKGYRQATFLPQVWEDLSKPEEFLGHLCMKAGMPPSEWRTGTLEIQTYDVDKFEE